MAKSHELEHPFNKPSNINVVKYMYKWYNETNDELWCKSCNLVIKPWKNESHLDTCIPISYYPNITTVFKCVPCGMLIDGFNQLVYHHVGTQKHLDSCKIYEGRLYSNECLYSKTVVYDTYKSIIEHSHEDTSLFPIKCLPLISVFMAELYKIRDPNEPEVYSVSIIHFCNVCEEWSTGLIDSTKHETHLNAIPLQSYNYLATFYCDSCNVTFFCDECTYKMHQSSIEHATLLETYEKKIHDEQYKGRKLPPIVRCYFENLPVDEERGLEKTVCNLCGINVAVDDEAVLKHLFESCTVWSITEPPPEENIPSADYNKFYCGCCSVWLDRVANWRRHVLSESHLMNCGELFRYTYFECTECFELYAGMAARKVGDKCLHELQPIDLSDLMRFIYKTMNSVAGNEPDGLTFYYWQETGNFGQCDRSDQPESVPNYCPTCRLEFYGDPVAFRKHTFTVEHLLLQYFKPISSVSDTEENAYVRELVSRLKEVRRPSQETEINSSLDITYSLCYEFLKKTFKN